MNENVLFRSWLPLLAGLLFCFLLCACGEQASAAHPALPIGTTQPTGSAQTILTDAHGYTLYFYIPDTPTHTACDGVCAQNWPPLLADASGHATSSSTLPGKLTVQQTTNGNQVEYNKHLLYTYIGDTAPGQMTGNGVDQWYVATTDLQAPASSFTEHVPV